MTEGVETAAVDTDMETKKQYHKDLRNLHSIVNLKSEIEGKLRRMPSDLNNMFLYRVVAFSLSGTCLVDLRCDYEDPSQCPWEARLACRLKSTQLTRLLDSSVMSRRKIAVEKLRKKSNNAKEGAGSAE